MEKIVLINSSKINQQNKSKLIKVMINHRQMLWYELIIPFLSYQELFRISVLCKKGLEGMQKQLKANLQELISFREKDGTYAEMVKIHGPIYTIKDLRKIFFVCRNFDEELLSKDGIPKNVEFLQQMRTEHCMDYKRLIQVYTGPKTQNQLDDNVSEMA